MQIKLLLSCLLLSALLPLQMKAYTGGDPDDKVKNDSSAERSLVVSVEYGTDRASYRRKLLNQNNPYYAPSLLYQAPSGFYSDISAYHLISPVSRWDEMDLNAGWDFHLSKKVISSV